MATGDAKNAAFNASKPVFANPKPVTILGNIVSKVPPIINKGPIAATNPPIVIINVCVPSSKLLNHVRTSVSHSTTPWNIGINLSPITIQAPSKADFKLSISSF